jgi:hypothetical protein
MYSQYCTQNEKGFWADQIYKLNNYLHQSGQVCPQCLSNQQNLMQLRLTQPEAFVSKMRPVQQAPLITHSY